MKMIVKVSLMLVLFGLDSAIATFNYGGNSIITIIEDNQGVFDQKIPVSVHEKINKVASETWKVHLS